MLEYWKCCHWTRPWAPARGVRATAEPGPGRGSAGAPPSNTAPAIYRVDVPCR